MSEQDLVTKNPRFLSLAVGIGQFSSVEKFFALVMFLMGKRVLGNVKGGILFVVTGYVVALVFRHRTAGRNIVRKLKKPKYLYWKTEVRSINE